MSFRRSVFALLMVAVLFAGCTGVAPSGPSGAAAPQATTAPAAAPATAAPAATSAAPASAAPAASTAAPATAAPMQATPAATATAEATAETAAAAPTTAAPTQAAPAGTTAQQYVLVLQPEASEARYRVREQLAGRNLPNDAVGVTKDISGAVTISADGAIDTANSSFVVDLTNLKSDQSRRDNYVKRNTLQTDQYPTVQFVPKTVTGLPNPLPTSGNVTFQVTGDLTIRDSTQEVTWDATGTIEGQQMSGSATTSLTFGQFNMEQPRVAMVLSIEDNIILEVDYTLVAQSAQ